MKATRAMQQHTPSTRQACRRSPSPRNRGAVIIELILMMPILFIMLLAIIEFGLIFVGIQQAEAAARLGAKYAVDNNLSAGGASVADATAIRNEVDEALHTAGFGTSATEGVRFTENVAGLSTAESGTCPEGSNDPPTDAIRVRVCIPLTAVTPDMLSSFGFSIASRRIIVDAVLPD